jgi:hypothetical protein
MLVFVILAILVAWVAILALVVGLLKVGTSTPTPQPAPRLTLAPSSAELVGHRMHAA